MQTSHTIATDQRGPRGLVDADGGVLDLTETRTTDPAVAGAKAANLARAAAAGLPVLPGFVLSTDGLPDPSVVREAWERLSERGRRSLVVRSSSTIEDAATSSMAGQFRSILGVQGWPAFERAVAAILESAAHRRLPGTGVAPMAVLVQQELTPPCAGVLFGVDPVTGNRRRLVVEAVPGSPETLVSGTVTAARYLISRRGHMLEQAGASILSRRRLHRLARIARRAEQVFGRPQDVEWAFDDIGRLWMLQSRPVTATGHVDKAVGPVLGPGPVSETFPEALRPLEVELWVAPLRQGIVEALRLTGAVSHRRLAASPVVTTLGGRVAADLELLGASPVKASLARALDPRRPARRLLAAWRVGRIRASLPGLARDTIRRVDRELVSMPPLSALSDPQLTQLLERLTQQLVPLHTREVLAGMLLRAGDHTVTAGAVALAELGAARAAGWSNEEIVCRRPVALALTGPRVGSGRPLPEVGDVKPPRVGISDLGCREALRLRVRWVQELAASAATELGNRLAAMGSLPAGHPELVTWLTVGELKAMVGRSWKPVPEELTLRACSPAGPPLPAAFRLTAEGEVVAVVDDGSPAGGRPAGGGRGVGLVQHVAQPHAGGVLVVETLSPELAASLPGLVGLVSETGSTLSHLAILARESGVPTVVGVADARRRFPPGSLVLVDGATGEVSLVTEPQGGTP